MSSETYPSPSPCKHLTNYKLNHGLEGYVHLKKWLKTTSSGRTLIRNPKSQIARCEFCSGHQGRLHLCLACSTISCCFSSPSFSDSIHAHLHSQSQIGHELAVDMDRAELYCCACCDQVYDPDFDKILILKQFDEMPSKSGGVGNAIEVMTSRSGKMMKEVIGRRRSSRRGLKSYVELGLMNSKRMVLRGDRKSKAVYPLGLRGLNNLGNTCFMNSVLQAVLHAPPLRNYFLTDHHNREFCRKRSGDQLCLHCDIDGIYSAVFSGDRMPYTPAQFLHSWWLHFDNLASYEQQDAHEFFISMLDQIHEREMKDLKLTKDRRDCDCIAHKAFSGVLQSDVTCNTCGSTSTTYDPCVDISLDLNILSPPVSDSPSKSTRSSESTSTLSSCLDLFTRPEKLGSDQKLYCEHCKLKRDSCKQMSIKRLPLVLCLHIKRFEHSPVKKLSRKVDQYLQFPFSLQMSPYLSSTIVSSRYGNRMFAFGNDNETNAVTEYEIFAIVTHSGKLESGHYTTYLRLSDQWYKCDDAWILAVDEETVRASQCYMIYYVQKMLQHSQKTTEDSSCAPPSHKNGAFLPIAGCC